METGLLMRVCRKEGGNTKVGPPRRKGTVIPMTRTCRSRQTGQGLGRRKLPRLEESFLVE